MSGIYGNMPYNFGMNYQPQSYQNTLQQLDGYMNKINNNNVGVQQPQNQQSIYNTNMEFIKVANLKQAKEWVVQNNQSVWMQDSSEPYLYYKSVDNLGSANFRILKVDDVTEQMLNGNQEQVNSTNDYVPIENFNELKGQVNILNERLNMYENFIDNLTKNQSNNNNNENKKASKPKSNSIPKEANK